MNNNIEKEIKDLVAKLLKIDPGTIDPNANLFSELGMDSMLGVEVFAQLDKKYNLDLPEDKVGNINTLSDLIGLVKEALTKQQKS